MRKHTHMALRRVLAFISVFALLLGTNVLMFPQVANALSITGAKDVLSTLVDSANANHTISWVSPSAVTNNTTITLTFATGFSLTGIIEDDVDIAGSTEGELTTAADCTSTEKAGVSMSGQVITITLCTGDGGDFTNSETITVEIGNHAAASGTGVNQINNQTEAQNNTDPTIDIVSGASDTGSVAVETIADDSVSVTATVDPTISFSISDVAVGFGILSTSQDCWAKATPPASCDTTAGAAHTLTAGTNASSGLAVTYNGATLTDVAKTITVATIAGDVSDPIGTPGTEQFALGVDDNGSTFTIGSGYDENAGDYKFVASTTTTLFSAAAPVASTAVDTHYLANIAANTEAGSYTTSITYIATGTF